MANQQQLSTIKQGADAWNQWREEHPKAQIDLSKADLSSIHLIEAFAGLRFPSFQRANLGGVRLSNANLMGTKFHKADLAGAVFSEADLTGADLSEAYLKGADLRKANLTGARLSEADLRGANLTGARLSEADLSEANLSTAHLIGANLSNAHLRGADLMSADLISADLQKADLSRTYLRATDLRRANLREANLNGAILAGTRIDKARFSGSSVCAVNFSELIGEFEDQTDLVITPHGSPVITVDNLMTAQFIYLILNHEEIRAAIRTLTSKFVLILGSFNDPERKAVLAALKGKLRQHDLLPISFDLERATQDDFTQAIGTLAGLAYFVIADETNPSSAPLDLQAILPDYQVPIAPIIQEGGRPIAMLVDLHEKHSWVLDTFSYDSTDTIVSALKTAIIDPAIEKRRELVRSIHARHLY